MSIKELLAFKNYIIFVDSNNSLFVNKKYCNDCLSKQFIVNKGMNMKKCSIELNK